jgi:hypothetical protein
MQEPKVTKEYFEDLGERDAEGFYDYAYRYWGYSFDFGERQYGVRVYIDEPGVAFVNGPTRWSEAPRDPYLRAIVRHVEADAGPVEVRILGPGGGYGRGCVRIATNPRSRRLQERDAHSADRARRS